MNTDNYRTLHKDIGLIQRTNNGWDLWFDNGDTVRATEFHSLQVGIIIACLTSWNYMNRYGNPTYEVFGNRAYELLKANKSSMVAYKIQQYFMECLKRMRRVYEIVYLNVSEVPNNPYKYYVEFEVISISNQLVDGSFTISADTSKSSSYIDYMVYIPYVSNENGLVIDLWLKNEYGGGLEGEILYMYLKKGEDDYQFMGVVGKTDETGYLRVTYDPILVNGSWIDSINNNKKQTIFSNNETNTLYFEFHGNSTYNPTSSKRSIFKTELFEYNVEFSDDELVSLYGYSNLNLTLQRISMLDNSHTPVSNAVVTITGTDGRKYEAITDDNGEATIKVIITETTLFTANYNDYTDTINVTKFKTTPIMRLSQIFINQGRIRIMRASLYDENENPLTENIDGLTVTFKREDESIISTQPVQTSYSPNMSCIAQCIIQSTVDEDVWIAELNGNDYYDGITETYEE